MTPDNLDKCVTAQSAFDLFAPRPVAAFPLEKRALDLILSTFFIVCAAPLLLLAAVAIKVTDGGPVVFWQRRVGQGGREFWFPKLRSMNVGAEKLHHTLLDHNDHGQSITFKMKADARVTRVGRVLRVSSLDELPQLWCVLKGEMSLVGPRPGLPSEVLRYAPSQLRRLETKPGMTGLWQVSGRSTIPFDGQMALDIEYLDRRSLGFDLNILARTVRAVVSCKGAW
jgi:lipopolysaccharide/colanic/teichoic acid biosynthesis glycosyltransferase